MGAAGLRAWRIAGGGHPVFCGEGARRFGGRWNSPGRPAIYCGGSFAICMLERLVYARIGRLPEGDRWVAVEIPEAEIETFAPVEPFAWWGEDVRATRAWGDRWLEERRSLALLVPSAVTRLDNNLVINPEHPAFPGLAPSDPQEVVWDPRLFPG